MGDMTLAIVRANNPCALRPHPGEGWRGSEGAINLPGGAYQRFTEMRWGLRAALRNLHTYRTRHNLQTPREIIGRWAPPSDNNPTSSYASNVARWVGVRVDDPIPFDYRHTRLLLLAIIRQETGGRYIPKAGDVGRAFALMVKEERQAGRDPSPYVAPALTRPIERTAQEAKRVPRRWWAGIGATIAATITSASERLVAFCSWALEECQAVSQSLSGVEVNWWIVLPSLAAVAAIAVLLIIKESGHENGSHHDREDDDYNDVGDENHNPERAGVDAAIRRGDRDRGGRAADDDESWRDAAFERIGG